MASEHGLERRALADHVAQVLIEADLVFEVQLFGGQLVLDLRKFAVGERVFGGNGNLARHLDQQIHLIVGERLAALASQIEHPEHSVCASERDGTARAKAQICVLAVERRRKAFEVESGGHDRLAGGQRLARREDPPAGPKSRRARTACRPASAARFRWISPVALSSSVTTAKSCATTRLSCSDMAEKSSSIGSLETSALVISNNTRIRSRSRRSACLVRYPSTETATSDATRCRNASASVVGLEGRR